MKLLIKSLCFDLLNNFMSNFIQELVKNGEIQLNQHTIRCQVLVELSNIWSCLIFILSCKTCCAKYSKSFVPQIELHLTKWQHPLINYLGSKYVVDLLDRTRVGVVFSDASSKLMDMCQTMSSSHKRNHSLLEVSINVLLYKVKAQRHVLLPFQ